MQIKEKLIQTCSGNIRILRCVAKLGFVVCNRYFGTRQVEDRAYDGLTFRLEK